MSAQGHSRRFDSLPVTSGLSSETDIARPTLQVRLVHTGDMLTSAASEFGTVRAIATNSTNPPRRVVVLQHLAAFCMESFIEPGKSLPLG
jgi:hypothetical protein